MILHFCETFSLQAAQSYFFSGGLTPLSLEQNKMSLAPVQIFAPEATEERAENARLVYTYK